MSDFATAVVGFAPLRMIFSGVGGFRYDFLSQVYFTAAPRKKNASPLSAFKLNYRTLIFAAALIVTFGHRPAL